ncbi:MAG: hypothetical protein O9325_09750 [Roseomonas sp.]|nr:hypothetical protein [Roseomonas sp.]
MEQEPLPPPEDRAAEAARAFEVWLQRSLQRLYGAVAREKVPPELRRLIERDRGRRTG